MHESEYLIRRSLVNSASRRTLSLIKQQNTSFVIFAIFADFVKFVVSLMAYLDPCVFFSCDVYEIFVIFVNACISGHISEKEQIYVLNTI